METERCSSIFLSVLERAAGQVGGRGPQMIDPSSLRAPWNAADWPGENSRGGEVKSTAMATSRAHISGLNFLNSSTLRNTGIKNLDNSEVLLWVCSEVFVF